MYIYVHSKCNVSIKVKTSYNLERKEYVGARETRMVGSAKDETKAYTHALVYFGSGPMPRN